MAKQNVVVGIDIGTTKVAVVVGQIQEGLIHIIGASKVPINGMRKGTIVDLEECVSAISAALEEAERMAGAPLEAAHVGIGGAHIASNTSKGVIAVSRADGEITRQDYDRVIEAARAMALPPNREIIDVIPRDFIVDGQGGVKDPIGMTAIRLETEALVVTGQTAAIRNLSKCVTQAGLKVSELIYTPAAVSNLIVSKKEKELGALLVDFGGGTTTLTVFEESNIIYTNILAIGSLHITNDLAIGLKTSLETAEKIKLEYGFASSEDVSQTQKIDLSKVNPEEEGRVERKMIVEIIEARLKEMFQLVRDDLKSIGKDAMLPAGVILTGGGSLLEGIVDQAKKELKLPGRLGASLTEFGGLVDKIDSPIFTAAAGLVLTGFMETDTTKPARLSLEIPRLDSVANQLKKLFRHFLP